MTRPPFTALRAPGARDVLVEPASRPVHRARLLRSRRLDDGRTWRARQVRTVPPRAGGRLAFSYHGDIWVAEQDGSRPIRLTAHIARDVFPRFSPDGTRVAFTSNRMGNDDVFVIPAGGGEPAS